MHNLWLQKCMFVGMDVVSNGNDNSQHQTRHDISDMPTNPAKVRANGAERVFRDRPRRHRDDYQRYPRKGTL